MILRTTILLDVFLQVREALALGVAEYTAALEALAKGFGTGSPAALRKMCQALWAKSHAQQLRVALAIDTLCQSARGQELFPRQEQAPASREETSPLSEPPPEEPESDLAPQEEDVPGLRFVGLGSPAGAEPSGSVAQAPAPRTTPRKWLLQGELPVSPREMKRAWRYLRSMARAGRPTELHIPATVARLARQGILVEPVLVPPRRNQSRVLLLIDAGGSMVPFRAQVRAFLATLGESGLAGTEVYYFHDWPGTFVFREPRLLQGVPRSQVLRAIVRGSVLIVGDAGAARGSFDKGRVDATQKAVAALRAATPRLAWINPVPAERWDDTSASAIVRQARVRMLELDKAGLLAAMNVLRGRGEP